MILVTGGAGFIGSALIAKLNQMGHTDILIVDDLGEDDKWKNLRGLQYSELVPIDELLEEAEIFEAIDFVFHMGACSSTTQKDVDFLMDNNTNYSKALWALCCEYQIPYIYASSAATYGDGQLGHHDDEKKVSSLRPLNAYGYSKQAFDQWVLKQVVAPPFWMGLKFFNVFGPNEYHKGEMRSLVHKAFGQINETGRVKLFKSHKEGYEDGEQLRDFVYVLDVVEAMIRAMEPKHIGKSGIYNIGTGQARSFKDLVEATFLAMKKKVDIEFIDMPLSIRGQYQYYTQANMNKFHGFYKNFEFRTLEESVKDYVQNFLLKDNPYFEGVRPGKMEL